MNTMKQILFSISSLLGIFAVSALMTGCAEEFNTSYSVEKPAEVVEAEQLAQYNPLKSYVDANTFCLGNTLNSSELDEGSAAASMTLSNFNEVTIPDLFVHSNQVDAEGNIDMLLASSLAKDVSEKGINIFAPALCASSNVNSTYLNKLLEPEIVEEDEVTGSDVIDFENDAIGATYPLKKVTLDEGKGTAVVEEDPAGESGHVVHVKGTNQSFPAITLKFPEGRKLGNYTELILDFYAVSNTAFNQKIVLALGGKNAEFKSAKEYGCTQKAWGRGKVSIPLAALAFSDEQNEQTEVTIIVGPKQLNCEYYIDNVSLAYKYRPIREVQKTEEEKFQIVKGELDKYIVAAMEAAPAINSWTVADCPVTSAADLIWKQTMGNTYFGYAAQTMRAQKADAKLFVSEKLTDDAVRADFITKLADADKISTVDGIDVLMSLNAATFNADNFATMLNELAATGKLIRLTIQSVTGADAATALGQLVTTYKQKVPATQQYGITFSAAIESATNAGLWTTGYNRKATYASLVEALQK